jgi:hypothetical protein
MHSSLSSPTPIGETRSPEQVELSPGFSVADCRRALANADRLTLVEAVRTRFRVRYINALSIDRGLKSGFAMMALACLMIEALESFRRGWGNTKSKSREAFRSFFSTQPAFKDFVHYTDEFYTCVRCGILHQAETRGGWRVLRRGPLLNTSDRTVNATAFLGHLEAALDAFCDDLILKDWDAEEWKRARTKLAALCETATRLPRSIR